MGPARAAAQLCPWACAHATADACHAIQRMPPNAAQRSQPPPQVLGGHNIICVEDLIHEIYTVGPSFKQVSTGLL